MIEKGERALKKRHNKQRNNSRSSDRYAYTYIRLECIGYHTN